MRDHFAYFRVVVRHKWFVFMACFKTGVPFWRAITHDWTKFTRREWSPYVHQFFNSDGTSRKVRDASGAYDPNAQNVEFKRAWLSHQRNLHHWQAWISIGDGGNLTALPIPETYIREMIADWIGAGIAYSGKADPLGWYERERDKMILHPDSRKRLEVLLYDGFH